MRESTGHLAESELAPPHAPTGYYRVKLFGQAGSLLYEAIVPPQQSFQYVCPTFVTGLKVYGFEMIWEPG
jgi:hypothetical protein